MSTSNLNGIQFMTPAQYNAVGTKDAGTLYFVEKVGSLKAWAYINASCAVLSGGNISSVTDNGTGLCTVNFTTNMPDLNYGVNITCDSPQGDTALLIANPITRGYASVYLQTVYMTSSSAKTFSDYTFSITITR